MYKYPKCGGNASKERIKVETYSESFPVKTGDTKCSSCGYEAPIRDFIKGITE